MIDMTSKQFLESLTSPSYGLMPDVVTRINEFLAKRLEVKLTTSCIGCGNKLFHVTLTPTGDESFMWLVAADSLEEAYITAWAEYPEHESEDDREDGYEIGRFI